MLLRPRISTRGLQIQIPRGAPQACIRTIVRPDENGTSRLFWRMLGARMQSVAEVCSFALTRKWSLCSNISMSVREQPVQTHQVIGGQESCRLKVEVWHELLQSIRSPSYASALTCSFLPRVCSCLVIVEYVISGISFLHDGCLHNHLQHKSPS